MGSAMAAIQAAEESAKDIFAQAEEKVSELLLEAKQEAANLIASATTKSEGKMAAGLSGAQEVADKKNTEREKEIEASVFREKESAIARKEGVLGEVYTSIIEGKI